MEIREPAPSGKSPLKWLGPLVGFALLCLAAWIFSRVLGKYEPGEVVRRMREIPATRILLAVPCMLLSYLGQAAYEYLGLRSMCSGASPARCLLAAFIGNTFTNNMGFSLLTGVSLRYRFYSAWGYSPVEIARVVVLAKLAFLNGLLMFTGILYMIRPVKMPASFPLGLPPPLLLGLLLCLPTLALLAWNAAGRGNVIRAGKLRLLRPPQKLLLGQLAVSCLHFVMSALVLFLLLPRAAFPAFDFLSAFMAVKLTTLCFPIPGSLGVLEGTAVALLTPAIPAYPLLGALLAYRVVYYLLPFGLAIVLLAGYEVGSKFRLSPRPPRANAFSGSPGKS